MYTSQQRLNDWIVMFNTMYGKTVNYNKSEFEIMTHLTEVTGGFGKHLLLDEPEKALRFLPKIFAWLSGLLVKVDGGKSNLEDIILKKYPQLCPSCGHAECTGEKEPVNPQTLTAAFSKTNLSGNSVDDFQRMFRQIYENTWGGAGVGRATPEAKAVVLKAYNKATEELAELCEALRFRHLHPDNFKNEVADLFSWWFTLVSTMHLLAKDTELYLASELLWKSYPGYCKDCLLHICDCRPGPVREMLSKPSLENQTFLDPLTHASNRLCYDQDLQNIGGGVYPFPVPVACIIIDLDKFKSINDSFGHPGGDTALIYLVNSIRKKLRSRDRLYRTGGDEFAVLCPDLSVAEAQGMISRIVKVLKNDPVKLKDLHGTVEDRVITLSVGILSGPLCQDRSGGSLR